MAVYYFRNTGDVNWGTATNWSLTDGGGATGAVPTAADDARFTANSGNCTTNASARSCLTLNCTGYTNTLTLTNALTVAGSITLSATMAISGAGNLVISANGTITGNSCNIPNLRIGSTVGITATIGGGALSVTNLQVAGNNSATFTINSNSINVSGNFTLGTGGNANTSIGTTTINLVGTGTWSQNVSGSIFRSPITINTSGTIACGSSIISYGTSTLTYIFGTVNALSTTLSIPSSCSLNVSGIAWGAFTIGGNVTITLLSNFQCNGTFTFGNTIGSSTILNGNTITVGGNLTTAVTTSNTSGTTVVEMVGTGSINLTSITTGSFQSPLRINTTGTITMLGNMRFGSNTITYVNGNVVTTGSTLSLTAATTLIDCHKIVFNEVQITSGIIVTMNEFFSGTATKSVNVFSATAGSTYTIAFQDGFEKITKFVNVSDCVISRRLQLLMLTNNSLVNCTGIRMNNQSPNGIPKNMPSVQNGLTFPAFSLTSDPTVNN
jgi:hypothetical protein